MPCSCSPRPPDFTRQDSKLGKLLVPRTSQRRGRWRALCAAMTAMCLLLGRSQPCFYVSISAYASIFLSVVHRFFKTEQIVRVLQASPLERGLSAGGAVDAMQRGRRVASAASPKAVEWCDFATEGLLCSTSDLGVTKNCTAGMARCKWFPAGAPVAVIFSDRLVKSGMVTMTSLCRHPTPLYVLVLMQVTATYKPIQHEFLSCKTISMTMVDGLQYLRDTGWTPDAICDGPGRDTLGKVTQPTLLGAAVWDKDPKHASCANHLRFYLSEFPILARQERILFVDDDVVIQKDSIQLYKHQTKPGVIFTANCDVNLWNQACQRFDVGRSVYKHFFSQAVIPDGAWDRVLELLNEASHGSIKYDPNHFEWNFGFNLMSLEASRRINMSATYERLASRLLSLRYLRGDSLVYGLGVPFLAYANRIECYTRAGWYVLDGLGYVPPAEMEVAGVTLQTISDAPVLHYNGERKPWGTNPFAEYVKAMGYWGQNLTGLPTTNTKPVTEGKSLKLVVLLSGPRTGTEWLAKVMADDNELVCGSIDDRTAPHPESLMPYDVACDNTTQIPCLSWHVVGPKNDSCDLRLMCQWRYVLSAARGISVTPGASGPSSVGLDSYEVAWREWGITRNSTAIFEGYLRRMMRLPTTAPELPCRCEHKQKILFLKFFLGWLERPKGKRVGLEIPTDYPFLRRFVEPGAEPEDLMYSIDARAVFRSLDAKVIYLYREPIAQYLSIQRGRRSELRGSGTAWHCFEVNQSKCPAKPKAKGDDRLDINVRDAGFFVIEALRLQKMAARFNPLFTSTFEDCVSNATHCVDYIYATLGVPKRQKSVLAARVSSSLNVVRNLDELLVTLAAIKAGNWSGNRHGDVGRKGLHFGKRHNKGNNSGLLGRGGAVGSDGGTFAAGISRGGGKGGGGKGAGKGAGKAVTVPKARRNVSFEAAVRRAQKETDADSVHVGAARCPRLRLLELPAYPLFAQIHRNRLAGMLIDPNVLRSLSLICVIGSQPEPSTGTYGLRGQVSAGDEVWYSSQPYMDSLLKEEFEMPSVLRRIRQEARKAAGGGKRVRVVLYSNPRGSNPSGVDTCTSYQKLEASAWQGTGALSWSEAGVLEEPVSADAAHLVLRPPALLMAVRHGGKERPACVIAPSHRLGGQRNTSICHVDSVPRPTTGWTKATRNQFYYTSLLRVGDEVMVVLNASTGVDGHGRQACHLQVRREVGRAMRHEQGEHALAPTELDAEAHAATCEMPVQYAFDYMDTAAANCVERHLEHALAVGADGSWLDNMGPNLYGAKTSTGLLLGSYDLRYPTDTNPEPCPRELAAADLEGPDLPPGEAQRERETAIYKFKLCRFSALIKAQGARVAAAVSAIHKMLGRKPLVYGNGLKHSFYWTGKEAGQVKSLYRQHMAQKGVKMGKDDMRPFAPNASENVIYYKVRGTREIMSRPDGPLDGFNMESFYGFIEVGHKCANWPIGEGVSLESCRARLDHPATNFWHSNVRVFANAARRNLRALAKVGQAGWKSVGQEYLTPTQLHRWVLGAYASFLMAVADSKGGGLMLGVHPFAQTRNGTHVQPWLHPVFFIDIGKPNHTEELIEQYQIPGHSTYARYFERGIVLYNPESSTDREIPLPGLFVDPWDTHCTPINRFTLDGESGSILVSWKLIE